MVGLGLGFRVKGRVRIRGFRVKAEVSVSFRVNGRFRIRV